MRLHLSWEYLKQSLSPISIPNQTYLEVHAVMDFIICKCDMILVYRVPTYIHSSNRYHIKLVISKISKVYTWISNKPSLQHVSTHVKVERIPFGWYIVTSKDCHDNQVLDELCQISTQIYPTHHFLSWILSHFVPVWAATNFFKSPIVSSSLCSAHAFQLQTPDHIRIYEW